MRGLVRRRQAERNLFLSKEIISSPNSPKHYPPKKIDPIINIPIGEFTLHMDTILEKTKHDFVFLVGDYNHNGHNNL